MTEIKPGQIILQQLGGATSLNALTGAKNFLLIKNGLSFHVPNRRVNRIRITVSAKDLYDIEFQRYFRSKLTTVSTSTNIGVENLKSTMRDATGIAFEIR
jgi:hypothetical protein